jgi:hypothetical protein
MSGLGAQARAAEYAAATAARARQVSRETGDQKIPPKAAPVSLGALAKAHSTGRNKGPKAWKPLNMDDITESSDDGSTGKESGRDTPQTSARVTLERTSFPYRQSSGSSTRVEDIGVNIPIAPRAMMTSNAATTVTANPSPQMNQSETIVNPPVQQILQNIYPSPVSFYHGGFPYPAMPLHFYSLHPDILGTHPNREAAQFPRFDSMIVPGDLNPTKQQQKFATLEQMQYAAYANNSFEASAGLLPHWMLPQRSAPYCDQLSAADASITGNPREWNFSTCGGTYVDYGVDQHPLQEHLDIGYVGDGEGDFKSGTVTSGNKLVPLPYGVAPTNYASNEDSAPKSYRSQAVSCSGFQYRRLSLIPTSETKQQTIPATYDYGEAYDRKSKMQSFVAEATQEALARKGKTVLHNPDLYEEKDQLQEKENSAYNHTDLSPPTGHMGSRTAQDESRRKEQLQPAPWGVRPRLSDGTWEVTPLPAEQGSQSKINLPSGATKGELEAIANGINNHAPGLGSLNMGPCEAIAYDPINGEPPDKHLNPIGQVGSVEWAHFHPITSIERERVRACMAKAAVDLAPNIPRPSLFDKDGIRRRQEDLKHSQEWFRGDSRGEQAFRAQLPVIAERHAMLRRATARHANGGSLPNDFKLGIDDGIAASIIMGEVIANLSSYVLGDRKSAEQRKNFHKVKSVPEFATERGGVSGALRSSNSYFDDQEGGFQSAPVRIARDPRFRPQGKEGLILKPEEEWKNRHEMYGRRVL